MKKPIHTAAAALGLLLTLPLFFFNCRKSGANKGEPDSSVLIARASAFVSNEILNRPAVLQPGNPRNDRTQRPREIIWSSAGIINFRGRPAVIAPLHFQKDIFIRTSWGGNNNFRLDNQAKLLVYQDSVNAWHAEVVTSFPDTGYLRSDQTLFTGLVLVDDYWGNPLNKYYYTPDGAVQRYVPDEAAAAIAAPKQITGSVRTQGLIQVCKYVYGYNYAAGSPTDGEYWVEFQGCSTMYTPDGAGGSGGSYGGVASGGGGGGPSGSKIIIKAPPDHPITNLLDYLKCFTNVGGNDHTYTVTICVDQPVPGTRTPWKLTDGGPLGSSAAGNIVDVGHTFLIFSEQYGGTTITRNVGFYPSGNVTPNNPASPGKLNNDDNHQYNIAATFTLTNANFFIMLNFLQRATDPNFYYNLNTENCTSFCLQTLAQAGIFLPNTIGSWPGGTGCDPGDLGEDIRQMTPLPNMTKSTSSVFHFNVGNCQ